MLASFWETFIQISIVLISALILGGLFFRIIMRLSVWKKPSFVIEEELYKLTTTPALAVERVFLREKKGSSMIQLILRNTGSLLSLHKIIPAEKNEVTITYLPHAENDQNLPEDYPQGTSMTLFLKGESIEDRTYHFYIVFQALDGETHWQEISGKGDIDVSIASPQPYSEDLYPSLSLI